MKRTKLPKPPEPDIRQIPDPTPRGNGLWWQAAEDRNSGDLVVSVEFCGRDAIALHRAIQLLDRMLIRLTNG